ncbi:VanZ family protein [Altererythrobacter atlanticus]|uniref:VanZ like family protein n=1 Tax=Croceibacterium atlanticum TaxID=1267766 RepID=A0A0F7KTV2_9SPHN|nr:hypothetical protein [Croceibacterium atlanticum]AKH42225.1 VanZ like family protein [Croceibacterium atlanticum]MBB5733962.1 VanZ family protein [Croceibacterium atlanticum]
MQQRIPWKALVLLITAVILFFALRPSAPQALTGWDKLDHMAAFFVLSVFVRIAWPRLNLAACFGLLALFGGGIELAQWLMGLGRDADVMDWVADLVATIAGLGVGTAIRAAFRPGTIPR